MATRVEEVLQAIEELSEDERQEVREALDQAGDIPPWATPLQRRMLKAGIIRNIADPRKRVEHIRSFEPISLDGEPVSEQIIRERR